MNTKAAFDLLNQFSDNMANTIPIYLASEEEYFCILAQNPDEKFAASYEDDPESDGIDTNEA